MKSLINYNSQWMLKDSVNLREKTLVVCQLSSMFHPASVFCYIVACLCINVFTVFEILLWYVQTGSWKEAFERVIPLRKFDKNELTDESTASEQTVERQTSKQGIKEQPVSSKQGIGEQQMSKQDDQKANKQEISVQGTSE